MRISVPSSVRNCVRWSWRRMPLLATRIQSVPGIARLAEIRGPASVASAIFQHNRAGDPVVGPSGPSIRSANVISYSRSIISMRPYVGEARRAVFARDPGAVGREADGVIPAGEHQQVKQLLLTEQTGQPEPQVLADVSGVVQGIGRFNEQPVALIGPARIARAAMREGGDLLARQAGPLGEERHVHSPLVLTPAAGARPVDDDLALTHRQREPFAEL